MEFGYHRVDKPQKKQTPLRTKTNPTPSKFTKEPVDFVVQSEGPDTHPQFNDPNYEKEHISLIMRDILDKSSTKWSDISGLRDAKALLEEAIVLPIWMPDYFTGIRRPWKGVLLYGPPGKSLNKLLLINKELVKLYSQKLIYIYIYKVLLISRQ